MRRILLTIILLGALGITHAQGFRINGGIDLQPLAPRIALTVTVERPSLDLLGVRWGPIATLKANTDFSMASVELLTGVGGAVVLPGVPWAVKVKVLLNIELVAGKPLVVGPDFQVGFTTSW